MGGGGSGGLVASLAWCDEAASEAEKHGVQLLAHRVRVRGPLMGGGCCGGVVVTIKVFPCSFMHDGEIRDGGGYGVECCAVA